MDSENKYILLFRPVYYSSLYLHNLHETNNYYRSHYKYSVSLFDPRSLMRLLPLEKWDRFFKPHSCNECMSALLLCSWCLV